MPTSLGVAVGAPEILVKCDALTDFFGQSRSPCFPAPDVGLSYRRACSHRGPPPGTGQAQLLLIVVWAKHGRKVLRVLDELHDWTLSQVCC